MDTPLKDIDCDTLYRIIKSRDFNFVNKIIYSPEFTFTHEFERCIVLIFNIKREDLLMKYLEIGKSFTPELLKLLIVMEVFQQFILKYPDLIKLSEDDVISVLSSYHDKLTLEVVHMGISKYKLTGNKVIFELFKKRLIDFYRMLVDEGTVEPTVDHLEFVCHNKFIYKDDLIEIMKYILDHKVVPSSKCLDGEYFQPEKISLLLNYGLKITYDDVYKLVDCGFIVPNFYKYGIKPNGRLLRHCLNISNNKTNCVFDYFDEMDFTPKILKDIFSSCSRLNQILVLLKGRKSLLTIEHLRNACSIGRNIDVIRYLIEEHGIKPDKSCLLCACGCQDNNNEVIEYLFSQGVKLDLGCLESYIGSIGREGVLDMPEIFDHLEIVSDEYTVKRLLDIVKHCVYHVHGYHRDRDCFMCEKS